MSGSENYIEEEWLQDNDLYDSAYENSEEFEESYVELDKELVTSTKEV